MNIRFNFHVFKELVRSDLQEARPIFFDKFIDITIWVVLTLYVTGYVMPYFGLKNDFGLFTLGSVIASTGLFELYGSIVGFLQDLEGERIINYYLTLAVPSWVPILSRVVYHFIVYFSLSFLMLFIGKLSLWNQLDLTQINYFKFILALIFQNIFYACIVIWVASMVKGMMNIGTVWARFIFPMWFMGGFQFSWIALYSVSPLMAYINLLNPMIYITETTRVAFMGQQGYINFWLSLLAILMFSLISLAFGIKNLKKRLDFV